MSVLVCSQRLLGREARPVPRWRPIHRPLTLHLSSAHSERGSEISGVYQAERGARRGRERVRSEHEARGEGRATERKRARVRSRALARISGAYGVLRGESSSGDCSGRGRLGGRRLSDSPLVAALLQLLQLGVFLDRLRYGLVCKRTVSDLSFPFPYFPV